MDSQSSYELQCIKDDLQSLINELDSIARGINRNFSGIGNDTCAACITRVANKYREVRRTLDNIDTKKVTDEYAAAHSGGGVRA